MLTDTEDFYTFIKQLCNTTANPNLIHKKIAQLSEEKDVTVITQNIDGLHLKAGSNTIEFHGTLASCYCETCHKTLPITEFLKQYTHEHCGGIIRPDVILYDEQIDTTNIHRAINALAKADVIVVVGTTFKVYPFASLIQYANRNAKLLTINKDPVNIHSATAIYTGDALDVFKLL